MPGPSRTSGRRRATAPALVAGAVALFVVGAVAGCLWGPAAVRDLSPTLAGILGYGGAETPVEDPPADDAPGGLLAARVAAVFSDMSEHALRTPSLDEATARTLDGLASSVDGEGGFVDAPRLERLALAAGIDRAVSGPDGGTSPELAADWAAVGRLLDADDPRPWADLDRRLVDGVGVVSFCWFAPGLAADLAAAVDELRSLGAEGIVVDLRSNVGGSVEEAVACASVFLGGGTVVEKRYRGGESVRVGVDRAGHRCDLPLVLLVSPDTSGAAEVFAAALTEHLRATSVGEGPTAGMGSIQLLRTLSFGGAVRYEVGTLATPDGRPIGGSGIVPDVDGANPEGLGLFWEVAARTDEVLEAVGFVDYARGRARDRELKLAIELAARD